MPASWRARRRQTYSERRHDVATRPTPTPTEVRWWRTPDGIDHAFNLGGSWMRSRCGSVTWTVVLTPLLFGPANACAGCMAEVGDDSPAGAGESVEASRG
jgi:hypothetical protein